MISLFKGRRTIEQATEQSLAWFKDNVVEGAGIIVNSQQRVPYPEVTGYFVPTLYRWGEADLARRLLDWLVSVQLPEGALPAPDGVPYTFDTGQVMRGFCAGLDDVPELVETPLVRACEWVLTQIQTDGRLGTPSTQLWGDIATDLIHVYVLPPLREAGRKLGRKDFVDAADTVLGYYKQQVGLTSFNRLSHFHAYVMEALWELGEIELVGRGMAEVESVQRRDGSIPAYPDVPWICSTGIAQYAVVWYRVGKYGSADRAMRFLAELQNPSGGFYGSYGRGANYLPKAEISWAVKYFLDAAHLRAKVGM